MTSISHLIQHLKQVKIPSPSDDDQDFSSWKNSTFFGCDPLELLWFWGSFACWWWWCIQHSLFSFWRIISIEGWGPSQIISFWAWHYSTAAASDVDYSLALAKPSLALICNWTFSYGNFLCSSIVVKEPEPEEESRGKIFTHAMPLSMLSFFFSFTNLKIRRWFIRS